MFLIVRNVVKFDVSVRGPVDCMSNEIQLSRGQNTFEVYGHWRISRKYIFRYRRSRAFRIHGHLLGCVPVGWHVLHV